MRFCEVSGCSQSTPFFVLSLVSFSLPLPPVGLLFLVHHAFFSLVSGFFSICIALPYPPTALRPMNSHDISISHPLPLSLSLSACYSRDNSIPHSLSPFSPSLRLGPPVYPVVTPSYLSYHISRNPSVRYLSYQLPALSLHLPLPSSTFSVHL